MARGRTLSPAYAKRIASALARGKTRQQARGHTAREHVHRAEREREEFGITRAEASTIRAWCARYNNESRDAEDVIETAMSDGYDWFRNYRAVWDAARRQYLREQAAGTYATRGLGYLEFLTGEAGAVDISWLYYH